MYKKHDRMKRIPVGVQHLHEATGASLMTMFCMSHLANASGILLSSPILTAGSYFCFPDSSISNHTAVLFRIITVFDLKIFSKE